MSLTPQMEAKAHAERILVALIQERAQSGTSEEFWQWQEACEAWKDKIIAMGRGK